MYPVVSIYKQLVKDAQNDPIFAYRPLCGTAERKGPGWEVPGAGVTVTSNLVPSVSHVWGTVIDDLQLLHYQIFAVFPSFRVIHLAYQPWA